ncbi:MAG: hypothetical protein ABJE66_01450 [Deltaproteobacteria bacterium]
MLALGCQHITRKALSAGLAAGIEIIARYGRLLQPDELLREKQVPPSAQFRFQRQLEPPEPDEGAIIERVAFERIAEPAGSAPRSSSSTA